jgi:hypothetical protein
MYYNIIITPRPVTRGVRGPPSQKSPKKMLFASVLSEKIVFLRFFFLKVNNLVKRSTFAKFAPPPGKKVHILGKRSTFDKIRPPLKNPGYGPAYPTDYIKSSDWKNLSVFNILAEI